MIDNVLDLPHEAEEYQQLVALLDEVIDIVGEDESHPLASLMETLGTKGRPLLRSQQNSTSQVIRKRHIICPDY